MGSIVVGILLLIALGAAVRKVYKDKKAGKCCGGDCAQCGGACHMKKDE